MLIRKLWGKETEYCKR